MPIPYLTLSEMNTLVQGVLQSEFCDRYWIVAELSEVHRRKGNHCYIELVEKEDSGNRLLAKSSAVIWNGTYEAIVPRFEQTAGVAFAPGIKVLMQVGVSFHEVYGLKFVVEDIDPSFTLGEQQLHRQRILEQLKADGVLTLNQELTFPSLPLRVAVVSSESAAGYGDFMKQLNVSPYAFQTKLFPAVMQGDRVETSVISALEEISEQEGCWDVVVIIRGGGAVSDLNGFESYPLAAHVAQFPLPILTGIGHERDETVIDLVAHVRLKTPTSVAAFLIDALREQDELLSELSHCITGTTETLLLRENEALKQTEIHLGTYAGYALQNAQQRLQMLAQNVGGDAVAYIAQWKERMVFMQMQVEQGAELALRTSKQNIEVWENVVQMADPERILERGFSITLKDGRAVTDVTQLTPGDRLVTLMKNGRVESEITEWQHKK